MNKKCKDLLCRSIETRGGWGVAEDMNKECNYLLCRSM